MHVIRYMVIVTDTVLTFAVVTNGIITNLVVINLKCNRKYLVRSYFDIRPITQPFAIR